MTFSFTVKADAPPSCAVSYQGGPFSQTGSGAPVNVAGSAFVVVRCSPAYGYDFETGTTTYTGPKSIAPNGTHHVRNVVETGDFEGVVTWVIGLDAQRPFLVTTPNAPPTPVARRSLVIAFSS